MLFILKKENKSKYLDIYKYQDIKYENRDLSIIQSIDIPILWKHIFLMKTNSFSIFMDVYKSDNNHMNILQYENHILSF